MSLAKLKSRRAAAVAAGLCQVCCRAPVTPGRRRCEPCAQRTRAYQQGQRTPRVPAVPFCVECQMARRHRWDCPTRTA